MVEDCKVSPNECLIFEDSYTGVLAGKNANIEIVNVYDKYADLDRSKIDMITDYSIMNYKEFIKYLVEINFEYKSQLDKYILD